MSKPEFVYVTYIATTPARLWEALTRGEFTRRYWYDRRIKSDWRVGSPVRFFDGASQTVTDSGVILECDPPRRLAYTFRQEYEELLRFGMSPEDARAISERPSRVTFTLEPHEGMVKLTLVHDELPDEQTARDFREGWAPILSSLKTFLESGTPLPELRSLKEKARSQADVRE